VSILGVDMLLRGDEKICLLRLSALGDVIMWLPVVRAMLRKYPALKITWVIVDTFYPMLEGCAGIEFIAIKKRNILFNWRYYKKKLSSKKFDILILGQASFRAHFLSLFISAKRRVGFGAMHQKDLHRFFVYDKVPAHPEHLLLSFMRFAQFFGITDCVLQYDLVISAEDLSWAKNHLSQQKPNLVINLASSKESRDWPVAKVIELLKLLRTEDKFAITLLGSASERESVLAQKVMSECAWCTNLVGKTSLKRFAALIDAADILLAPDTAALHLASAFATPAVGLHAAVPASKSGAYGFGSLAVDYYYAAAQKFLNKSKQQLGWGERVHDAAAMDLLPVADVVVKINQALELVEKNKVNNADNNS
jgi:heptosyltransferase I